MSHELDFDENGNARMMYNRQSGTPWHSLGTPVDGLATAEEAIVKAGLDWNVELRKAGFMNANGNWKVYPGQFVIVRDVDDKPLGRVSKRYVPVQNLQAFNFTNALVDSDEAIYDTAGALREGKEVFLSAKLPEGVTILGEKYDGHLLFHNAHTGLAAVTVRCVLTRVVCANTLSWAFGEATPVWSFPHVTGIEEQLEQARETLKLVTAYEAAFATQTEQLAAVELELSEMIEVLKKGLPDRQRSDEVIDAVTTNVTTSKTIPDELRKTGFGLVSGLTEWAEHVRPSRSLEGRFHAVTDGDSSRATSRVVKLLLTR